MIHIANFIANVFILGLGVIFLAVGLLIILAVVALVRDYVQYSLKKGV